MSFASVLNSYCSALNCTNAAIAERCGISPSALSRYRNGGRIPSHSDVATQLARGIVELSKDEGSDKELSYDEVAEALESARKGRRVAGESFGDRVDQLMIALNIRNVDIARATKIDPSYLSRIRNGQRNPVDRKRLAEIFARAAAFKCVYANALDQIVELVPTAGEIADASNLGNEFEALLADDLMQWLLGDTVTDEDVAETKRFFDWLNEFDFEGYLRRLSEPACFDGLPAIDLTPRACFYSGIERMQDAEFEFLNIAAQTDTSTVYLTSDVPMREGFIDESFLNKLIERVERIVQSGSSVRVVHSLERTLSESLVMMQDWIPIYLTGQVTPHFLRGVGNRLFAHTNYVCDICALSAESMMGHLSEGRSYFTLLPEDVAYYQRKMSFVIEKCEEILEVYLESRPDDFERFEEAERIRRENPEYREVCAGEYERLRVMVAPSDCVVISLVEEPRAHFVIRLPKLRYAASLMS